MAGYAGLSAINTIEIQVGGRTVTPPTHFPTTSATSSTASTDVQVRTTCRN